MIVTIENSQGVRKDFATGASVRVRDLTEEAVRAFDEFSVHVEHLLQRGMDVLDPDAFLADAGVGGGDVLQLVHCGSGV